MKSTLEITRVANPAGWNKVVAGDLFLLAVWNNIEQSPWKKDFPYQPHVRFQIVHSDTDIYLRYEVQEEFVKGQYVRANENVYEDSCVEFFISLDGRKTYYNFEFNVLGTGLIGHGTADKATRKRFAPEQIDRIDVLTEVSKLNGVKEWNIILRIPKDLFLEEIKNGVPVHANFYKCGDSLPNPHFIAWKNIENPTPNFHLPQYFGEVIFK